MVIKDIERTEVPFICHTLGCIPVAHIDNLTADKLSTKATNAQIVILNDGSKVFHIDVDNSNTSTILV
jgi:T-complex protein 1 subunit delta